MSAIKQTTDFSQIVTVKAMTEVVDTQTAFDGTYKEENISPIDQFIKNVNTINLLYVGSVEISREFSTIVFLGYMSAVESYIRALVRGLIQADIYSLERASEQDIKFGAAMHHTKQLLPEALMDYDSFVNIENIRKTFKDIIGIDLAVNERISKEFDKICQLRHCCVHRFGKLGAKNAMSLGISQHSKLLEKPLNLNKDQLELISQNLRLVVKHINNSAYEKVMQRSYAKAKGPQVKEFERLGIKNIWSGLYATDRECFKKYYSLFATKIDSTPTDQMAKVYKNFIQAMTN